VVEKGSVFLSNWFEWILLQLADMTRFTLFSNLQGSAPSGSFSLDFFRFLSGWRT